MFSAYVLKSIKNNKRYIGSTSKPPLLRLKEHNAGANRWTRANKPFIIVYEEQYNTKIDAIKRERFLKSGQGRKYLDSVLQ